MVLQTVSRWETGVVEPRKQTVDRAVRALEARGIELTKGGRLGLRYKAKIKGSRVRKRGRAERSPDRMLRQS